MGGRAGWPITGLLASVLKAAVGWAALYSPELSPGPGQGLQDSRPNCRVLARISGTARGREKDMGFVEVKEVGANRMVQVGGETWYWLGLEQ